MGRGKVVERISSTDVMTKEVAIRSNQPRLAVENTDTIIAIGAARAAPAVSSDMCAAESSARD